MTDTTDDNNSSDSRPALDKQARLERLLTIRGGGDIGGKLGEPAPVTLAPERFNLRYNTHTDTFTNLDTRETFTSADIERVVPGDNGEEIEDDGRSLEYEWSQNAAEWARRQAILEEVRYDPITGERRYVLQGTAREQYVKEFAEYDHSMRDQKRIYLNIQAQRERKAAQKAAARVAEAEREEDLSLRALAEADEAEVRERAAVILAERRKRANQRH